MSAELSREEFRKTVYHGVGNPVVVDRLTDHDGAMRADRDQWKARAEAADTDIPSFVTTSPGICPNCRAAITVVSSMAGSFFHACVPDSPIIPDSSPTAEKIHNPEIFVAEYEDGSLVDATGDGGWSAWFTRAEAQDAADNDTDNPSTVVRYVRADTPAQAGPWSEVKSAVDADTPSDKEKA